MDVLMAILFAVVGGLFGGLIGVGGGLLFVPALTIFLGLSQVEAEATSLLAILPTVAAGTWRQHAYENVRWRAAAVMGTTAVVGVEIGVVAAKSLAEPTLRRLFGVLVLAVAAQLAWRARRSILVP